MLRRTSFDRWLVILPSLSRSTEAISMIASTVESMPVVSISITRTVMVAPVAQSWRSALKFPKSAEVRASRGPIPCPSYAKGDSVLDQRVVLRATETNFTRKVRDDRRQRNAGVEGLCRSCDRASRRYGGFRHPGDEAGRSRTRGSRRRGSNTFLQSPNGDD